MEGFMQMLGAVLQKSISFQSIDGTWKGFKKGTWIEVDADSGYACIANEYVDIFPDEYVIVGDRRQLLPLQGVNGYEGQESETAYDCKARNTAQPRAD
jgi:hypothetical protein